MATTSRKSDREEKEYLRCSWMNLQKEELAELEHATDQARKGQIEEQKLKQLIQKFINNFQDYVNNRSRLAGNDVFPFFAPATSTPLENSVLWIAGCRPSSFIRLVYALTGMEAESRITQFLQGIKSGEVLHELSAKQFNMINELQGKTIREERKLSTRFASLQEDMVDQPLISMAMKEGEDDNDECENADEALDKHSRRMAVVMQEADELRMKTLKDIVTILEPVQAVEYLAAAKKIRFCVNKWGKKRDNDHIATNQ